MFDLVRFARSRPTGIGLATRAGNHIDNAQAPPPTDQVVAVFDRILQQHGAWIRRKGCCGTYNCFGHVWASRRTCIFDSEDVWRILREDEYRRIEPEHADRGDVAIYLHKDSTTIWHAGVIEPRQLYGAENPVPWVLSKLNEATGEVLHPVGDVHAAFEYDTQIWTDRCQGSHDH